MDPPQPAYHARVAQDEQQPPAPLPTLLQRRATPRPRTATATGQYSTAEPTERRAAHGGAAIDEGYETSPHDQQGEGASLQPRAWVRELVQQDFGHRLILPDVCAAAPVPIEGHHLSLTSAIKGFFHRSPLSPKTPRTLPKTSPRTPRSDTSTTPRPRRSTPLYENSYFPPTASPASPPHDVASSPSLPFERPFRPRSTSAPAGELVTVEKKGFFARMRVKLGHFGDSHVESTDPATAGVHSASPLPATSERRPAVPPFRRAASGPAKLLARDHREENRRVSRGLTCDENARADSCTQSLDISVEVQQEEHSDHASTSPDISPRSPFEGAGDDIKGTSAEPPSCTRRLQRHDFPASDDGLAPVSSLPHFIHSTYNGASRHSTYNGASGSLADATLSSPTPRAVDAASDSLTRSTSSSPTPRASAAAAAGNDVVECIHPFLGAPVYNGPLRVPSRPSSMRQRAYGTSWTNLSLGLSSSDHTADVRSIALTSFSDDPADIEVWPPRGLTSRFSDWTPTEPETRSSYHSSLLVSLVARHELNRSCVSLHNEYWPRDLSPAHSDRVGVLRHPASNSKFHPLLTPTSRQRILSLRRKRSAAALVDWPSLEIAAPNDPRPSYPIMTCRARLPRWPYSLSDRSVSRKTAEPSVVCAREQEAWSRESRPEPRMLVARTGMVSVGVQTD